MRKIVFAVGLLALLLLAGCAEQENSVDFFAMDTYLSIRAYGADDTLLQACKTRVESLEKKLSVTEEGSEIFALNENGQAALSPETAALLEDALALCEKTDGALDVTVYPVVRAWGFTTGEHRVPTDAEIETLLQLVDYRKVLLSELLASVPDGMMLDLGSVAKGYAGDCICALLRDRGVKSAILDLGGNVQVVGTKPNGKPWKVAVRAPEGEEYLGILDAQDEAVVTSGGYERFFIDENGVKRCHIMNPETGCPAESGLASVTVVGQSGTTCDGLSTALFVMGREGAEAFWRAHGGFEMLLLSEDGTLFITPELSERFEAGNYPLEVICP